MARTDTPFRIARQSEGDTKLQAGRRQNEDPGHDSGDASDLAGQFAQSWRRRAKVMNRHRRHRNGDVDRWDFPDDREERNDRVHHGNTQKRRSLAEPQPVDSRWASTHQAGALPGGRRNWILSGCAVLLLALSVPFAVDFVGRADSNSSPPIGEALAEAKATRSDPSDILAQIAAIRENAVPTAQMRNLEPSKEITGSLQSASPPQAASTQPVPKIVVTSRHDAPPLVGGVLIDNRANLAASAVKEAQGGAETVAEQGQTASVAEVSTHQKNQDRLQTAALTDSGTGEADTTQDPLPTQPSADGGASTEGGQPAELKLSAVMVDGLLARGEALLRGGDIVSARLIFLSAAEAGDLRGAWGVGMTFDPEVHERLSVKGLEPDREQAEIWYRKAGEESAFMTIEEKPVEEPAPRVAAADDRNAACARKYKSYNPSTGLYRSYSGVMRRCRLP